MVSLPVTMCFFLLGISFNHAYGQEAYEISQAPIEPASARRNYNSNLTHEIPVSELGWYCNNETGREHLKAEFHSVREGQRKPWVVGSLPININKNRYDDLLAYDETRVCLRPPYYGNGTDYINANYMTGYWRKKEYVATQGPLNNTINDFWKMICKKRADTIVMVANFLEHGVEKVANYLPEKEATYGNITVRKISEVSCKEHIIRTFEIKAVQRGVGLPIIGRPSFTGCRRLIVRHFHFTGWPDFGVPQNHCSILALLQQARKYHLRKGSNKRIPLVVHCSAGVGRTGTVILTDSELQRAMNENGVDIYRRLDTMRGERINVVEKDVQYIWAYEAIYQWFYGNATKACVKEYETCYSSSPELRSDTELSSAESTESTPSEPDEISTAER